MTFMGKNLQVYVLYKMLNPLKYSKFAQRKARLCVKK